MRAVNLGTRERIAPAVLWSSKGSCWGYPVTARGCFRFPSSRHPHSRCYCPHTTGAVPDHVSAARPEHRGLGRPFSPPLARISRRAVERPSAGLRPEMVVQSSETELEATNIGQVKVPNGEGMEGGWLATPYVRAWWAMQPFS